MGSTFLIEDRERDSEERGYQKYRGLLQCISIFRIKSPAFTWTKKANKEKGEYVPKP